MLRTLWRAWLPVVGACGLLSGCEHVSTPRYPPDPLLLSKKPVPSRPEPAAVALARHEPPAPQCLVAALAPRDTDGSAPTVPASLSHEEEER
jgi:hypothetical protein